MSPHHLISLLTAATCALLAAACSGEEPAPSANAGSGGGGSGGAAVTAGSSGMSASAGSGTSSAGQAGAAAGTGGSGQGGAAGAAGAAGGGAGGAGGGGSNVFSGKAQLMVLGSSNELQTCWRALLWKKLGDNAITDFDFVGGVSEGPECGVQGYDKDLQAQNGIIITNLTEQQFAGWFTAHPPDALLVHYGGADLLANMAIPGIMAAYTRTLDEARKVNPKVRMLIGQHTPMNCESCATTVPQLNGEIATWAGQKTTADSPVVVVDLATGVDPATDTSDGIHLNTSGSTKVADRFYGALSPFFGK